MNQHLVCFPQTMLTCPSTGLPGSMWIPMADSSLNRKIRKVSKFPCDDWIHGDSHLNNLNHLYASVEKDLTSHQSSASCSEKDIAQWLSQLVRKGQNYRQSGTRWIDSTLFSRSWLVELVPFFHSTKSNTIRVIFGDAVMPLSGEASPFTVPSSYRTKKTGSTAEISTPLPASTQDPMPRHFHKLTQNGAKQNGTTLTNHGRPRRGIECSL